MSLVPCSMRACTTSVPSVPCTTSQTRHAMTRTRHAYHQSRPPLGTSSPRRRSVQRSAWGQGAGRQVRRSVTQAPSTGAAAATVRNSCPATRNAACPLPARLEPTFDWVTPCQSAGHPLQEWSEVVDRACRTCRQVCGRWSRPCCDRDALCHDAVWVSL